MTKKHIYFAVGLASALILVAVLAAQLAQTMPVRWSVAFWLMIAGVLTAEFLAKTVLKRQFAKIQGLETLLDIVSVTVTIIACYFFARYFYPGTQ